MPRSRANHKAGHSRTASAVERDRFATWSTLLLTVVFLGAAHLAVKEFFPSPAMWIIGAAVTVVLGVMWIVVRKDEFGFLVALFVCAHFAFADNQGGFWAYILCGVVLTGSVLRGPTISLSSVPRSLNLLLIVFLLFQLLGTFSNPYSLVSNIQATVVAAAQLLVFYWFASQSLSASKLKHLFSFWFMASCCIFLIGLNQRYHWLITPSPLLPQRYLEGRLDSTAAGSFGNSELFGEYFCVVFVFSLIVLSHARELLSLRIKKIFPLLMIVVSAGALTVATSRAAIILTAIATIYLIVNSLIVTPSVKNLQRVLVVAASLLLVAIMLSTFGSYVSTEKMGAKFSQLRPSNISLGTVLSGKEINRGSAYGAAYRQLGRGSWLVGYGYNLAENNQKSMGIRYGDFHNLYLMLAFFYGWVGAAAYVMLVFGTCLRIYARYLKARKLNHFLVPIALGLAIMWGIFLLDEWKISATRNPSYFLITWMWLGLSHSVANSLRRETYKPKKSA